MVTKSEENKIKKLVEKIPSDGEWWHSGNAEAFVELAIELCDYGLTINKSIEILTSAYYAVSGEYGI